MANETRPLALDAGHGEAEKGPVKSWQALPLVLCSLVACARAVSGPIGDSSDGGEGGVGSDITSSTSHAATTGVTSTHATTGVTSANTTVSVQVATTNVSVAATTSGSGCTGQFQCDSGQCVANTSTCDGIADCFDGSDEAPLNPSCPTTCGAGEFSCDGGSCYPTSYQCDGIADCLDGSDESTTLCGTTGTWTCDPSYFGDGLCDCGCGQVDSDCGTSSSAVCEFCDDPGSCAVDCSEISSSNNATCI